jgi:ABC-2 type transport system permease protein
MQWVKRPHKEGSQMNTESNTAPESFDSQRIATNVSPTRPLHWSVRRELWENRSIYLAPLAAAAVYFLGYLISLIWVPRSMRAMAASHASPQLITLAMPYSHAAMLLMATGFLVGIFYSLDALHGERRDRSILFWKSLPVSDLTTVLSKASIPFVILPLLVFLFTVSLQIVMRLLSTAAVLWSGRSVAPVWTQLPLFEMQLVLLYSLIVLVLWHAPIYMWFLLVSGWARRATFLWAVFPPLALAALEYIAFHTSYLGLLLRDRLIGFAAGAFDFKDKNGVEIDAHFIPLAQLAPGRFLSSPGLWLGLIFAAILFVAAVRLRRYREPL